MLLPTPLGPRVAARALSSNGRFGRLSGGHRDRGDSLVVVLEDLVQSVDLVEFVLAEAGGDLLVDTFADGTEVAEAEVGDVGAGFEVFVAEVTFGLELAEFGGAFVEQTMGLGAGAVDGSLEFGRGFILHRVGLGVGVEGCDEAFFDLAAAAETPHGAADFVDEIVFEDAGGGEVQAERVVEFGIEGLFAGTDEVVGGEEAVFGGVFGRRCFALFGAWTGGGLRVGEIGRELCGCRHFR